MTNSANLPSVAAKSQALTILRMVWGNPQGGIITAEQSRWLAQHRVDSGETMLDVALRLAGLLDQYVAAGSPKHATFRNWFSSVTNS